MRPVSQKLTCIILLTSLSAGGCSSGERHDFRPAYFFDDQAVIELTTAAQAGDVDAVDAAVAKGVNVNAVGKHGATPLMLTFLVKNKAGYKRLLKHGADPNIQEERGRSVTSQAASEESDSEWLKDALAHGGNPNDVNPKESETTTPLFCAIDARNIENARALIAAGAKIDLPNGAKHRPVIYAAIRHDWDIVYLFLEKGADYRSDVPPNISGDKIDIANFLLEMRNEVVGIHDDQLPWYDKV